MFCACTAPKLSRVDCGRRKVLASGSDNETIKLWDPNTGVVLQTLEGHSTSISSVTFSPTGKLLASGSSDIFSSDSIVKLWDTGTGAVLQTLEGHSRNVSSVAFSPGGKVVASGFK